MLGDYVSFYFTPWSVMMSNIRTGHNGVTKRANDEIVILVSSLRRLEELGARFVFTNGHAYVEESEHFDSLSDLDKIDWELLQSRDFKRDPEDPGKLVRYQAEALVHRHVPISALLGIACYDEIVGKSIRCQAHTREMSINVKAIPNWYF